MNDTLIIYNPYAGRGLARSLWPQVQTEMDRLGIKFDVAETIAVRDATRIARSAVGQYRRVVSLGGDGTLHEVVNGLLQASAEKETIPLGIIPLGSGDDFAKMLPPEAEVGGKALDWCTAVAKLARDETHLFDVARISGAQLVAGNAGDVLYMISNMDIGFAAHTVANMASIPGVFKGVSAYLAAVLKTWIHFPVLHLKVQFDDQDAFEITSNMASVVNVRSMGGGFWVCPQAKADDGLLDIMLTDDLGRMNILRMVPLIMKGQHVDQPTIHLFQAKRISLQSKAPLVVQVDGELPFAAVSDLVVAVLPRCLRVIV